MAEEPPPTGDSEQLDFPAITSALESMARLLGLRETFLTTLLQEKDDWSLLGGEEKPVWMTTPRCS
jgi:hypothetical protein